MRDVWLIRHAESVANIGEATTTPREIPLSTQGFRQADRLAEQFAVRPDLIVVSPYDRAEQTAQPLKRRFPNVRVLTLNVQEFTYLSIERSRGTNSVQRKPWVDEYWLRADPHYQDGGQSESFSEFINRVEDFVRDIESQAFAVAAVVTHEQVIKALIWNSMAFAGQVESKSMAAFHRFMNSFKIPNTAILPTLLDDGKLYFGRIDRAEDRIDA